MLGRGKRLFTRRLELVGELDARLALAGVGRETAATYGEPRTEAEEAKRFDLLILNLQLIRLRAEPGFERLRDIVRFRGWRRLREFQGEGRGLPARPSGSSRDPETAEERCTHRHRLDRT